ncbi:MAG TPA: tetratricopeptide repeat protein [Xanthobacteraceae bacterium]
MTEVREPRIGDVAEVAKAIRMASADDGKRLGRTIFFIGAGCSSSARIPLAAGMAQTLIVRFATTMSAPSTALAGYNEAYRWLAENKHVRDCRGGDPNKLDARPVEWPRVYEVLFGDHYTTPDDVREIFSEIVDKAGGFINWAHLCLGELVRRRIVSTVITTNFDQLVLSGMVSSGVLPVVSDGIESLSRIRGAPHHPQLVELHGSRHTYRLRNPPEEVTAIANNKPAITAIGSLFQDMRAFVVVGYGGREDGIMDLLINVAEQFPDKRLIWVSHDGDPKRLSAKARQLLATSRNAFALVGQDADSFFLKLLQELKIGAPESVREPLFLANLHATHLATHAPADVADHAMITAEIARHRAEIETMKRALEQHRNARTATETAITQARELRLAGKLAEAIRILEPAAEQRNERPLWRELGEISYNLAEASPDRGPVEKAVKTWRRVLAMTERKSDPSEWARTQVYLGLALHELGKRDGNAVNVAQAVAAYREALTEYTRERNPLAWALTQNNLGNALRTLGERESDTARLEEAVAAYREALKERTRERVPLDWAATQHDLGNALATLGNRESGTARLRDAVAAYREALKEYTRERVPLDWAMSTGNQGVALMWLAKRRSDAAMARMALEQMETADHAPNIAFYDARLRDARALVASLIKP